MRGVARSALWKPSFLLTQVGVIGVLLSLRTSVGYSQVLVIPTLPGLEKVGAQALKPQWAPVDSVALELMKRPGMDVVRYQADRLEYRANDGLMMLVGKKGASRRGSASRIARRRHHRVSRSRRQRARPR